MDVRELDPSLKRSVDINLDKRLMVLEWLLEFRFSSFPLLSERLGKKPVNCIRFFNGMIDDGVIQVVQNIHTGKQRYAMLSGAGVSLLEARGFDVARAVTRTHSIGKYTAVLHDLAVQYVALRRLKNAAQLISERNMHMISDEFDRPDLVITNEKGLSVAIEYERWRKDSKRVYISFLHHYNHLKARHYSGVYYLFDNELDCENYKKLFAATEWPRFQRIKKTGLIKPLPGIFKPDEIEHFRDKFVFAHEPVKGVSGVG